MSVVRGRRKARAITVLESLKETEKEQAFRKTLSTLQPAAGNSTSLVGCCGTTTSRKIEKLKPILSSKENSPMKPRRSKRKANLACSEETKIKSSTPVSSDAKSTENTSLKQQSLTKYSKKLIARLKGDDDVNQEDQKDISEHPEASLSGISIRSESSGYCSDGLEKPQGDPKCDALVENKLAVEAADEVTTPKKDGVIPSEELQNSPSIPQDVYDLLVSDKVSDSYWKDLAEQRRQALEETLHENELLHDQLEVLEAENSRLTSLVRDAEKLAEIVKDILE